MTIQVGSYSFEGPFAETNSLQARSGVYVILGRNPGQSWAVLDVGESGDVRGRVASHDRRDQWRRSGKRQLACCALYCNEASRLRVEQELRSKYDPPCGQR